jgi:hypothetical protein
MKKTITLLAMAALVSSATFAQYNHSGGNSGYNKGREVVVNSDRDRGGYHGDRDSYFFSEREKDMQIASINREYYRKSESVKDKFFMSRYKKEQLLYSLKMERDAEVRSVFEKFNDRRNKFGPSDDRFDRHDGRDRVRW